MKALARDKGLNVPASMLPKHQAMLDRLRDATDENIGQTYRDQQVQAHDEAVDLFTRAARDLEDADLKGFAERTLPVLREHRDMLR